MKQITLQSDPDNPSLNLKEEIFHLLQERTEHPMEALEVVMNLLCDLMAGSPYPELLFNATQEMLPEVFKRYIDYYAEEKEKC